MIRELRREDAEAVAQLALTANPHRIETAELIWQRASTAPQEAHRRDWVAGGDTLSFNLRGSPGPGIKIHLARRTGTRRLMRRNVRIP